MSSWYRVPDGDKWMDSMWKTPDSLKTPEMVMRRRRATIVAIVLAMSGTGYKYATDPKWETTIDGIVHRVGEGLELTAWRTR